MELELHYGNFNMALELECVNFVESFRYVVIVAEKNEYVNFVNEDFKICAAVT